MLLLLLLLLLYNNNNNNKESIFQNGLRIVINKDYKRDHKKMPKANNPNASDKRVHEVSYDVSI